MLLTVLALMLPVGRRRRCLNEGALQEGASMALARAGNGTIGGALPASARAAYTPLSTVL